MAIDNSPKPYAYAHHGLGLVKRNMKQFEDAIIHLDSALILYNRRPDTYRNLIIDVYNAKGSANDDLERYEAALKDYQKAIGLLNASEEGDLSALYDLYNNLSITYKKLDRNEEAIQLLQKSLRLKKEQHQLDFHNSYTATYNNLGDVFLKQKKFEQALNYYQLAIQNQTYPVVSDDIKTQILLEDINMTGLKTEFLTALFSKAKGLQIWAEDSKNENLLEAALHTLESACLLIDWMRREQSEDISKLFWREQTHPIYEQAIEVAYQLNRPKKAYDFFEKSKAALLLDVSSPNIFFHPPKKMCEI